MAYIRSLTSPDFDPHVVISTDNVIISTVNVCNLCNSNGHLAWDQSCPAKSLGTLTNVTPFAGVTCVLSNFYPCPITFAGRSFTSTEHAYQHTKAVLCKRPDLAEQILMEGTTPQRAKSLGKGLSTEEWEQHKLFFMRQIALCKLDFPEYRQSLLGANPIIAEAVPGDTFWSAGLKVSDLLRTRVECWPGFNAMGKIHMDMRNLLINSHRVFNSCMPSPLVKPPFAVSEPPPATLITASTSLPTTSHTLSSSAVNPFVVTTPLPLSVPSTPQASSGVISSGSRGKPVCPFIDVTGCDFNQLTLPRHLGRHHISPYLIRQHTGSLQYRMVAIQHFLLDLAKMLGLGSLAQLLTFFHDNDLSFKTRQKLTEEKKSIVFEFHQHLGESLLTSEIDFFVPNTVSVLAWYKNACKLCKFLSRPQALRLASTHASHPPVVCPSTYNESDESVSVQSPVVAPVMADVSDISFEDIPLLSDAHFHLDEIAIRTRRSHLSDVIGTPPAGHVFNTLIASYCFPSKFPSPGFVNEIELDHRVHLCVGVHPKVCTANFKVPFMVRDAIENLPKVVAIGEVGLDYSIPNVPYDSQARALKLMAQTALDKNLPIVIHTRESPHSEAMSCNSDCIQILREILPPYHPIYKHCLTGYSEAILWKAAFPQTIFGINGMLCYQSKKSNTIHQFLQQYGLTNVVIETDSPFLHPQGRTKINSPSSVLNIAEQIAQSINVSLLEVLAKTNANVRQFFRL